MLKNQLKEAIRYIRIDQQPAYYRGEKKIYNVEIPRNLEGTVIFRPGNAYVVTLPSQTGDLGLYFNGADVYVRGQRSGLLNTYDNVYIRCDNCYLDLKRGMYGVPTNINADMMIVKDAKYLNITEPIFKVTNPKNDFKRTIMNNILSSKGVLVFKDSKLNIGTDKLNVDCEQLMLNNSRLYLPYTYGQIKCDNMLMEDSIITADQDIDIDTDSLMLENSQINFTSNIKKHVKSR